MFRIAGYCLALLFAIVLSASRAVADTAQTGSTFIVNTTADSDDGLCGVADCSLREAINLANGMGGTQTVTFNLSGDNPVITLQSVLPRISGGLVVQGPVSPKVTISGAHKVGIFDSRASLNLQNLVLIDVYSGTDSVVYMQSETDDTTLTVSNCTISGAQGANQAIRFSVDTGARPVIEFTNCIFTDNDKDDISVDSFAADVQATVNITGCSFSDIDPLNIDWAYDVYNGSSASVTKITNCTFSGCRGGAVVNQGKGSIYLDSVSFVDNQSGGGAAVVINDPLGKVYSRNCLYAGNISFNGGTSVAGKGTMISQGHNLLSDSPPAFTAAGDQVNQWQVTGMMGPLAFNGGPTPTRALLTGNPAIDAGSTTQTVDQRGTARPQAGAADIGAFEGAMAPSGLSISSFGNQTTPEDTPLGPIPFTVGSTETAASNLTVSGTTSFGSPLPNSNLVFGGSGANRTVTVTPPQDRSGTAAINLVVSDGTKSAGFAFLLTVTPVNDAPMVDNIADRTIAPDTSTGAIPIVVVDIDSFTSSFIYSGSSDNLTLVPQANIVFSGTAGARKVTVTPAAGQTGTAIITITVSDGFLSTSKSFVLNVGSVPQITSFSPGLGIVGTNVVIIGSNFTGATAVTFNETAAAFTVNSATQITAQVPTGTTTGVIKVKTSGGTATSAAVFTIDATAPEVAVQTPANDAVLN